MSFKPRKKLLNQIDIRKMGKRDFYRLFPQFNPSYKSKVSNSNKIQYDENTESVHENERLLKK